MQSAPYEIEILDGNLLDYASPFNYIAHQCNCMSSTPKHLSASIFGKFPHANIYKKGIVRIPGNIIVRGSIVNMLSQKSCGRAGQYGPESYTDRRNWLKQCLQNIFDTPQIKIIFFPYGICCGAAGDDWSIVGPIFNDFAHKMLMVGRKVALIKYNV
jgi:hypothetical protein